MFRLIFLFILIVFASTMGLLLLTWTFDSGMENCVEVPNKTICLNE